MGYSKKGKVVVLYSLKRMIFLQFFEEEKLEFFLEMMGNLIHSRDNLPLFIPQNAVRMQENFQFVVHAELKDVNDSDRVKRDKELYEGKMIQENQEGGEAIETLHMKIIETISDQGFQEEISSDSEDFM